MAFSKQKLHVLKKNVLEAQAAVDQALHYLKKTEEDILRYIAEYDEPIIIKDRSGDAETPENEDANMDKTDQSRHWRINPTPYEAWGRNEYTARGPTP